MTETGRLNLDLLAAQRAQQVIARTRTTDCNDGFSTTQEAGDVDNLVTKCLGVLQENGIYAAMLYLLSRTRDKEKRIALVLMDEMLELLEGLGFQGWEKPDIHDPDGRSATILEHITRVTGGSLERLLLAKETLEQMLIYARYGAKARNAEGGGGGGAAS